MQEQIDRRRELLAQLQARLAISFHHLYLGAMLRWLAEPRLKLRKEFAAAVDLFLHGAAPPVSADAKPALKSRKKPS
jgi:hypothetical protein